MQRKGPRTMLLPAQQSTLDFMGIYKFQMPHYVGWMLTFQP